MGCLDLPIVVCLAETVVANRARRQPIWVGGSLWLESGGGTVDADEQGWDGVADQPMMRREVLCLDSQPVDVCSRRS